MKLEFEWKYKILSIIMRLDFKKGFENQVWWHTSIILVLRRLRQEDLTFKGNQGSTTRLTHKNKPKRVFLKRTQSCPEMKGMNLLYAV